MKIDINRIEDIINIIEISVKIRPPKKGAHQNLLAEASINFKIGGFWLLTLTTFTVWISKINGQQNVQVCGNKNFKHCIISPLLKRKIDIAVLDEYDRSTIPIIE